MNYMNIIDGIAGSIDYHAGQRMGHDSLTSYSLVTVIGVTSFRSDGYPRDTLIIII